MEIWKIMHLLLSILHALDVLPNNTVLYMLLPPTLSTAHLCMWLDESNISVQAGFGISYSKTQYRNVYMYMFLVNQNMTV